MVNVCVIDNDQTCKTRIGNILNSFFEFYSVKVEIDMFDDRKKLRPELWRDCAYDLALFDISARDTREEILNYSDAVRKYCQKTKVIFMSSDPLAGLDIFNYAPDYFIYKLELDSRLHMALEYLFHLEKKMDDNSLVLETKSTKYIIPTGSILYCEHYQRDTKIVCKDNEIICHEKLSDLLKRLDRRVFLRCHCSFLVNIRHVKEFNRTQLVLDNGKSIPCSRANTQSLKDALIRLHKNQ